ncbi:MAG: L-ribulose-5-phosphate 4-epimerase AraD, partial [Victivallales bacterium]|nr:L-ribulose-5-phosphate 4-epimerase AraD [Victivallales bacterium]
ANMQLPKLGLVIYTFGNVSCIDRASGVYAIKPSGVDYKTMSWQDMVVLDLQDNIIDGSMCPSSDAKTHTVLYNAFENIGGIVHTHSTYAVAWAQAKRSVPIYGTTHADHLACDIPCTEVMLDEKISGDYEKETGYQIINTFKAQELDPDEVKMVLVASHGPFTWDKDAANAVYNSKVLEELCKMAILSESIAPELERMKKTLIQKHYKRKHGKDAYYGQN